MDAIRRWLPLAAPLAFAALLLAAALVIARSPQGRVTITPARLWLLAGVLLVAGAPLGLALQRVASDAALVALLGLGAAVDVALFVAVLAGVRAGLLTLLIEAGVGAALVSRRLHRVEPDTAVITTLAGQYCRTLLPATHVLLPRETALATLPTGIRTFVTPPLRMTTAGGAPLQASARMRYHLIPEQAHRAIHADAQWERTLHRLLAETVMEELARGASNAERLRANIERLMRDYGLSRGIRIESVWVEGVVPGSALATAGPARATPVSAPPVPAAVPAPTLVRAAPMPTATVPLPVPASTMPRTEQPAPTEPQNDPPKSHWWERPRQALHELGDTLTARLPGAHPASSNEQVRAEDTPAEGEPPLAGPDEAPMPSAEVLTAAYEAVREGRINDPTTVRQVADAFIQLAHDERLASALDFDPERAAQLLQQRAQMLSDPTRAPEDEPSNQRVAGPPPAPPRDDNVIRGG
jgi:hypothetical protein